jgi:hypothetical protein
LIGLLVRRWNGKSALLSSLFRAAIFFAANLAAGWRAAIAAMSVEFRFRNVSAGFFGTLTQAIRQAEPMWLAASTALVSPTRLIRDSHGARYTEDGH